MGLEQIFISDVNNMFFTYKLDFEKFCVETKGAFEDNEEHTKSRQGLTSWKHSILPMFR